MFADTVVLTYQSPNIPYFTYKVPENLAKKIKVGQLVKVPFGNRTPIGLVVNLKSHPEQREGSRDSAMLSKKEIFRSAQDDKGEETQNDKKNKVVIKPINSIVFSQPLLLPYQIELLRWMSAYYMAPMVNCLEVILPKIPNKLFTDSAKTRSLLGRNLELRPGLKPTNQTLVLVPSINSLAETMSQFPKAKNYVIYHNELKYAEKFAAWLKIISGDVDYIFGSRSTIFTPCPNLKEIIIHDEHDHAYKDERSPYFDTLTIAEKISTITNCKIKIVDISPKITTYFQFKDKINLPKGLPTHLAKRADRQAKIIDMQKERLGGSFSPISFESEDFLKRVAKSKKSALIYLNKKKESGYIFCKTCKNKQFADKQPQTCPSCNSPDIFFNSLNVYSLATTVRKTTPKYPVNIIDQSQKNLQGQHSIDIATSYIFYTPILKKYELVILTFADSLISVADFANDEKLYQTISKLKSLLVENGLLVIQTYNPNQPTIVFAAKNDYKSFYSAQLSQRKLLAYPPYSLLIKLTLKGKDAEKLDEKAQETINNLRLTMNDEQLTINGPYKSIFWQKVPACHIILKYKLDAYSPDAREKAITKLQFLRDLKDVQIKVEPESLN